MIRSLFAALVLVLVAASSANAQTYAGAGLAADVVRMSHSDSGYNAPVFGDGEAFGFDLRLGTAITDRWGVEVQFVRPSEIESEGAPTVNPLASSSFTFTAGDITVWSSGTTMPTRFDPTSLSLPIGFSLRSTSRHSTVGTSLWVRQEIADRAALVYLGGVGFHRTESQVEYTYDVRRFGNVPGMTIPSPLIFPPITNKTASVSYTVRPMVGVEGRIRMTDNVELVPGLRLHGIMSGWLVRPGVALHWVF